MCLPGCTVALGAEAGGAGKAAQGDLISYELNSSFHSSGKVHKNGDLESAPARGMPV